MKSAYMIPEKMVDRLCDAYNAVHGSGVGRVSSEKSKVICYEYGKKDDSIPSGVIIGSQRGEDGKLYMYQTTEQSHVEVVSCTGSGKTNGYVCNTIFNADKHTSYVVVDPKGEVAAKTYYRVCETHGEENVHIYTFRDPWRSQRFFNPFQEFAEKIVKARGLPEERRKQIFGEVTSKLQKVIDQMCEVTNTTEPEWQQGANKMITAFFLAKLDDVYAGKTEPRDVTIRSLVEYCTEKISWTAEGADWGDSGFFSRRSSSSPARNKAKAVLGTSSRNTRTSYLSILELFIGELQNPKTLEITRESNYDFIRLTKKPQIVYLVYDMADEAQKDIVNLTVSHIVGCLREEYENRSEAPAVQTVFLIDEFDSLKPKKSLYPSIISTGRSMGIHLHLILQSEAQLRSSYGEKAQTILENCNVKIFLGTNHAETAEDFVKETGKSYQLSRPDLRAGRITEVEKPRLSVGKILFGMEKGEGYVKLISTPVMHTFYEFAYKTPEYNRYKTFCLRSITPPQTEKDGRDRQESVVQGENEEIGSVRSNIISSVLGAYKDGDIRIIEDREELDRRRAEILKMMGWRAEQEELVKKLKSLTKKEYGLVENGIKEGKISVYWVQRHASCSIETARGVIERLLDLNILKRGYRGYYSFTFGKRDFKYASEEID